MEVSHNIEIQIINAFVDNNKGGNPAGVVLNADHLSHEQKLTIAKNIGLSETAFVSNSQIADFKLEFFTPTRQIAHCGHATIATFSYLAQLGKITKINSSKETIDGVRAILLQDDMAFMQQNVPRYTDLHQKKDIILTSLGLHENDLLPNTPISIVNTGNSFAIIPVASPEILKNINPDFNLITQLSEEFDLIGYYVFCLQANSADRDASTRMFAPRYGIQEESGTGMAAGPLACYLHDIIKLTKNRFLIEQGWFMKQPSPSLIIVDLQVNNDIITKVMAGGKGIPTDSISVQV